MQANLNRRAEKARFAVNAAVLQKISGGYRVPSRTQVDHHIVLAHYQVKGSEAGYRMTCHYEGHLGNRRCPGNQFGHICWHCLAALMAAVGKQQVAFFEDFQEAKRYQNLGGKLCTIWSGDGPGKLCAVVRRKMGKNRRRPTEEAALSRIMRTESKKKESADILDRREHQRKMMALKIDAKKFFGR